MKKQTCNCPAYDFPHRQGGGRCSLPSTCDFMFPLNCLDPEETNCSYLSECPLVASIEYMREQLDESFTIQERNPSFRSW